MDPTNCSINQDRKLRFVYSCLPENAKLNPDVKGFIECDLGWFQRQNVRVLNHTDLKITFQTGKLRINDVEMTDFEISAGERLVLCSLKDRPHIVSVQLNKSIMIAYYFINLSSPLAKNSIKFDGLGQIYKMSCEYAHGMKSGGRALLLHTDQNSLFGILPKDVIHLIVMGAMAKYQKLAQELDASSLIVMGAMAKYQKLSQELDASSLPEK